MATFVFIDNGRIRPAHGTRIIKATDYSAIGPAIKVYDEARKKADEILNQAESAVQTEMQKGYEEGLRKAKHEMAEQMTTQALRTNRYYRDMEKQVVQLVMEIVKKVLNDVEPETRIVAQVKNAISAFKGSKRLTIKANPADAGVLNKEFSNIMETCSDIATIEIKADTNLSPNSLIMESETGIVEASLDTQLQAIKDAIQKELQLPN